MIFETKPRLADDIISAKSETMPGCYVNNKEVETKMERFIYRNGKILTKVYRGNHLCMIKMANR